MTTEEKIEFLEILVSDLFDRVRALEELCNEFYKVIYEDDDSEDGGDDGPPSPGSMN